MGFTLSAANANGAGSGAVAVTITVPAGSAVGVIASMGGTTGQSYLTGSTADTGLNTYTPGSGVAYGAAGFYSDSFYCLNTGSSATSVTYTPPAYTGLFQVYVAVWVWTVSGGPAIFGSQSSNPQSAPGTGADAVTSGSVNCSTGSVIMGACPDTLTAGTGFTQDYSAGGFFAEHGAFNANHAATFTSGTGGETILSQAISFGLPSSGATIAWVT
jgi:hypothetical protein